MQYVNEINAHTSRYLIRCSFRHVAFVKEVRGSQSWYLISYILEDFLSKMYDIAILDQLHRWSDLRDRQRAPIQMFDLANALRNEEICADIYNFNFVLDFWNNIESEIWKVSSVQYPVWGIKWEKNYLCLFSSIPMKTINNCGVQCTAIWRLCGR